MSNWALIIYCGLITYFTRFTMIALIKKEMFNDRIREILSYVPSAIFPAIIFPAIFINDSGLFQLENISTAIATARIIKNFDIKDTQIKLGITKIKSTARLQEIKSGKLKDLVKDNKLFVDGSHNSLGAKVLNEYLQSLDCNKHIILGMMANKDHNDYMSYFKDISTLTTIDIPNQPNSIKGIDLKNKLIDFKNVQYKKNIFDAIKSIPVKKNDIILITGSLYLAGEVLNLN